MSIYNLFSPFSGTWYFEKEAESPEPKLLVIKVGYQTVKPYLKHANDESWLYNSDILDQAHLSKLLDGYRLERCCLGAWKYAPQDYAAVYRKQ